MLMKRVVAAVAIAGSIGAGAVGMAVPAQATPRGTLFGYFDTRDDCLSAGYDGLEWNLWYQFNCWDTSPTQWGLYVAQY
ncbi:MAG: hypothetical protein QOD39_1787 [Mycobacterium sp.]|jgi:hypothetical protein|nr:hypothetical protein [Mycobacterium sp.]